MTLKRTVYIIYSFLLLIVIFIIVGLITQPSVEIFLIIAAVLIIIVSLAAQDILRNIFGGIIIFFDKSFREGDKIEIGENYGEVFKVGLRSIKIITADSSVVNIPNTEIMKHIVRNKNSGEQYCQVVAEFYLPVEIDTIKARELALEAARVSKYIYLNKPVEVLFSNEMKEKESYLKMILKAYVMDVRYEFIFKSEMTEIVLRELISEGIIKKNNIN